MLGVSYALLGYALSPLTYIIYNAISGTAWGFLLVIYLAIPGDLALHTSKEKFYALGTVTPFIIYMSLGATSELLGMKIPASALSPVLTIILFLSVIPVFRAVDTLPENKKHAREMRAYLEKVRRRFQKSKEPE